MSGRTQLLCAILGIVILAGCPTYYESTSSWPVLISPPGVPDESLEWARDIEATDDGGFVLAGRSWLADDPGPRPELQSAIALRTTGQGDVIWWKTFGTGSEGSYFADVTKTLDGGFVFAGVDGSATPSQYGGLALLLKLDGDGNVAWSQTYPFENRTSLSAVSVVPGDGFIALGSASFPDYRTCCFLLKTDDLGVTEWMTPLEQFREFYPSTFLVLDDSVLLAGIRYPAPEEYPEPATGLLAAYDLEGTFLWEKSFDAIADGIFDSMKRTPDGEIIAASTATYPYEVAKSHNALGTAFLLKLNENGDIV